MPLDADADAEAFILVAFERAIAFNLTMIASIPHNEENELKLQLAIRLYDTHTGNTANIHYVACKDNVQTNWLHISFIIKFIFASLGNYLNSQMNNATLTELSKWNGSGAKAQTAQKMQ